MSIINISLIALTIIGLGIFSWKKPRLSSILIWSLIATILISSMALIIVPFEFSEKAQWLSLIVPILLVGLQYWCYWVENERAVLFTLIILCVCSGSIIIASDPII